MEELETLLSRAQEGDAKAYGEIVSRFQDMAAAYAMSLLGDWHLAEDASQEAFVEALVHLNRVEEARAFPAWLKRIVLKHCDRIRRGRRIEVPLDPSGEPAEAASDALSRVEATELARQVRAALASLPPPVGEVAHLYYLGSHSHSEIAAFLDLTPSAVNNRLYQARKLLRKELLTMATNELDSQRPSRDSRFVEGVVKQAMSGEELASIDRLHEGLGANLSSTLTHAVGRPVEALLAYTDQTTYEQVVQSFGPAATVHCAMGAGGTNVMVSVAGAAVAALLEDGEAPSEQENGSRPTADQIIAFRRLAGGIVNDLGDLWSARGTKLRGLRVSNDGPRLEWLMDEGMTSTGFARAESVVVIVGFEIQVDGKPLPSLHGKGPSMVICYAYDVAKAHAL